MKDKNIHIMDDRLVKYLLGEADATEQQEVQQWINENTDNAQYFHQFQSLWEASAGLAAKSQVDENEAWERFQLRLKYPQGSRQHNVITFRRSWLRAAAILITLVGVGWLTYYLVAHPTQLQIVSGDDILVVTLPDESVVTLNKHTTLSYPKRFSGNSRKVTLVGEAFFEVTADGAKPFVVHANHAMIEVLGTSFNIKSAIDTTEVIVATGVVSVNKNEHSVMLHSNEKAIVRKTAMVPEKQTQTDELYNYYHTQAFVCNGTPLWRLTAVLSDAYDVEIILADRLKHLPLTATFRNESLDHILHVISETFHVQVQRHGQQIIIK